MSTVHWFLNNIWSRLYYLLPCLLSWDMYVRSLVATGYEPSLHTRPLGLNSRAMPWLLWSSTRHAFLASLWRWSAWHAVCADPPASMRILRSTPRSGGGTQDATDPFFFSRYWFLPQRSPASGLRSRPLFDLERLPEFGHLYQLHGFIWYIFIWHIFLTVNSGFRFAFQALLDLERLPEFRYADTIISCLAFFW